MGGRRVGSLKIRVGRKHCIGRGGTRWARLNSGSIQAGGARRGRHSVGRCGTSWRSRNAIFQKNLKAFIHVIIF